MSNMMDILLADGQRLAERRATAQLDKPASRADKIIAACDAARVRYRVENQTADSAMVFGRQIGMLNGEVRRLCNEIEALTTFPRDPALLYYAIELPGCLDAWAGISCEADTFNDDDAQPETALHELWYENAEVLPLMNRAQREAALELADAAHTAWLKAQGVAA